MEPSVSLPQLTISPSTTPDHPGWRVGELFHGLSREDFDCVSHCLGATFIEFSRGDRIVSEHDATGRIGVMLSGIALDISEHADGTSSIVDVVEPGSLFGDGWERDTVAAHALVAATDGRVTVLESSRLVGGYSRCTVRPQLVDNFLRATLSKNERLREHLELVSRRSLRDRVMHYLRAEVERNGSLRFTIPLSRAELADYLHADRAAISRELSRMRAEGLLSYHLNSFALASFN